MTALFSIQVNHEYFQWEADPGISIKPTKESLSLIRKYGFLTGTSGGKFKLYTGWNDEQLAERMNYLARVAATDYIELQLTASNSDFYNYTDFPVDFTGRWQYSSQSEISHSQDNVITLKNTTRENGDFPEFACVKIYFHDIIQKKSNYSIKLSSRKTRWEYYIVNTSKVELESPEISVIKKVGFSKEEEVILKNGQTAIPFLMKNQVLPLTSKVEYVFDLTDTKKSNSILSGSSEKRKIIVKGLPNPSPAELKIVPMEEGYDVSSPMYVYI